VQFFFIKITRKLSHSQPRIGVSHTKIRASFVLVHRFGDRTLPVEHFSFVDLPRAASIRTRRRLFRNSCFKLFKPNLVDASSCSSLAFFSTH
jgi:hypothetical protein